MAAQTTRLAVAQGQRASAAHSVVLGSKEEVQGYCENGACKGSYPAGAKTKQMAMGGGREGPFTFAVRPGFYPHLRCCRRFAGVAGHQGRVTRGAGRARCGEVQPS